MRRPRLASPSRRLGGRGRRHRRRRGDPRPRPGARPPEGAARQGRPLPERAGAASFDLVHARFQLAPLGREDEQIEAYARLLRPGGVLVLEDPDSASWGYEPQAPGLAALVDLIRRGFRAAGGDFDAGRRLPAHLRALGIEPELDAHVVALPPGHPYLRLPLQFAASLRPRLVELVAEPELDRLLEAAAAELEDEHRWGLTFTLVQAWGPA